jgi:hypothetical protein
VAGKGGNSDSESDSGFDEVGKESDDESSDNKEEAKKAPSSSDDDDGDDSDSSEDDEKSKYKKALAAVSAQLDLSSGDEEEPGKKDDEGDETESAEEEEEGPPAEKQLPCETCSKKFPFSIESQAYFKEKGFSPPIRCPTCVEAKKKNRGARGTKRKVKAHAKKGPSQGRWNTAPGEKGTGKKFAAGTHFFPFCHPSSCQGRHVFMHTRMNRHTQTHTHTHTHT